MSYRTVGVVVNEVEFHTPRRGTKYVCNVHEKGNGLCEEFQVAGFDETLLRSGDAVFETIKDDLVKQFREYGLSNRSLKAMHPRFTPLRQQ